MTSPDRPEVKGPVVEEWLDLRFFRPVGARVARWALPRRISPDQLTLACLVIGLLGGHLLWYQPAWVNWLGCALLFLSDVFDSADGQLARMRGTSTRLGRVLDGLSDSLRFINVYVTLAARAMAGGAGWEVVALALVALLLHSLQASAADFIRQAYLRLGAGRASELDLPEAIALPRGGSWRERLSRGAYAGWVRRQALAFPRTVELVRRLGPGAVPSAAFRARYDAMQAPWVRRCWWLAQNIRFALVALTLLAGRNQAFFWLTIALTGPLVVIVASHEANAARLLGDTAATTEPEVSLG